MGKKAVSLKISGPSGFNEDIKLGEKTYHIQTEHGDKKNPVITTLVYNKGEIVVSRKTDYTGILDKENFSELLKNLMETQHKNVTDEFTNKIESVTKRASYFDTIKKLLQRKNNIQALRVLQDALKEFPEDPFIMSYYGCMISIVDKKHSQGIDMCKKALTKLNPVMPKEEESLYAAFYLNLGRAYLAGGEKKLAIDSFNKGIKIDKKNNDIQWELVKLGARKKPLFPFLSRRNPFNKYIGLLFSKLKGK